MTCRFDAELYRTVTFIAFVAELLLSVLLIIRHEQT